MYSGLMSLCDMRLGPTEDGYEIPVSKGVYEIYFCENNRFYLILNKAEKKIDLDVCENKSLESVMGVIGIYDTICIKKEFNNSIEEVFDWVDINHSDKINDEFISIETNSNNKILCFPLSLDGEDIGLDTLSKEGEIQGTKLYINQPVLFSGVSDDVLYCYSLTTDENSQIEITLSLDFDDESIFDEVATSLTEYFQSKGKLKEYDVLDLDESIYNVELNELISKDRNIVVSKYRDSEVEGIREFDDIFIQTDRITIKDLAEMLASDLKRSVN